MQRLGQRRDRFMGLLPQLAQGLGRISPNQRLIAAQHLGQGEHRGPPRAPGEPQSPGDIPPREHVRAPECADQSRHGGRPQLQQATAHVGPHGRLGKIQPPEQGWNSLVLR